MSINLKKLLAGAALSLFVLPFAANAGENCRTTGYNSYPTDSAYSYQYQYPTTSYSYAPKPPRISERKRSGADLTMPWSAT